MNNWSSGDFRFFLHTQTATESKEGAERGGGRWQRQPAKPQIISAGSGFLSHQPLPVGGHVVAGEGGGGDGVLFFSLFGFGLHIKWKHVDESDVHLKCMYTSDCWR